MALMTAGYYYMQVSALTGKEFQFKLSCNEVYHTACSLLVIVKHSCCKLHCQKDLDRNSSPASPGVRVQSQGLWAWVMVLVLGFGFQVLRVSFAAEGCGQRSGFGGWVYGSRFYRSGLRVYRGTFLIQKRFSP